MDKEIGPYKIVRLIGSGVSGSVYEAFNPHIERRAAIKTLSKEYQQDTEFVQRFFNEARAVNIINHPSVVAIYDVGTTQDGAPYIVMEYLEGDTLRRLMSKGGRLDTLRTLKLFRQIASGLALAHAKNIVHRDLKPANILIVSDTDGPDGERAKILDFGIAKLAPKTGSQALTKMGESMGTPAYMSPELCRDAHEVTDRSDVYSLGVMLFEALAGEHPFSHALTSDNAMMASHIGQTPAPLESKTKGLSPDLLGLVNRMLAKQPDVRPSAAEVAATLSRLTGSATGLLPMVLPPLAAQKPQIPEQTPWADLSSFLAPIKENRPLATAASALLLLGLVGLGIVLKLLLTGPPGERPKVRWTIDSLPQDAEVVSATGQTLGRTPLLQIRLQSNAVEVLSVRKDGYREARIPCDLAKDMTQQVVLSKLQTDEKPAQAVEPTKPIPQKIKTPRAERNSPKTKDWVRRKTKDRTQKQPTNTTKGQ